MPLRTSLDDTTKAFEEIKDAPDRTAAIVAAVLLEAVLEDAIVTRLRPMSNTHRDLLFEGEAGFAGFAAKINLGFSLGLYGPKTKNDFDFIRKIRNQFAHYINRHFGHPEVSKFCRQIALYDDMPPIDPKLGPDVAALMEVPDLRWRYLSATNHLAMGLLSEIR